MTELTNSNNSSNDPLEEIIPIVEVKGMKGVDARSLQAAIGSTRDFSNWIKDQKERAEAIEDEDFLLLTEKGEQKRGGSNRKDYHLSVSFAKELCLIAGGSKGKSTRRYFIAAEKAGRELSRAIESANPMVLRKMADLAESKQVLEIENNNLVKRQAVIEENLSNAKQELEVVKPMAEYGEKVFCSENLYTPTNVAAELGMRHGAALNQLLREKGVIKKGTGSADYAICARFSGRGFTKYKNQIITHNSGVVETKLILRWTRKGFDWLLEKLPKYIDKGA